ncbi:calcitonin gene-related peptide type 1 receptor isoform X1 [Musca domestica]|uniref:Calcitonin gene-related peptide type 1 receptor isoform X1 n=1 Tax=Musca domestica TaxID=7370 RepID=A0A9J7DFJ5_MUSDO|nr:calcitonin gene-related peptide type 1 receptor isoform X1 [Musca domestica]
MDFILSHLHRPKREANLKEFLSHLFVDCMVKYKNQSQQLNETSASSTEYPTAIPRYVEDAILNEGSIDIENVDVTDAERNELYATISAATLTPNLITTQTDAPSDATTPSSALQYSTALVLNASEKGSTTTTPSTPGGQLFCPLRFDGYLCWPRTPAGTVLSQYCPDFVEGFSSKFLAHKTCLENGTWYHHPDSLQEWSNYTNCIDYEDLEFRTFVNELYVKGYSVSCVALFLSLIIFLGFKSLRCTRIRIHVHLFASLAFTCITWIMWYKLIVEDPQIIRDNPYWCIILHLVIHYFMLVNYFWMFCEGLHLHLVLVVYPLCFPPKVFVKDTIVMRWFKIFSWLSPLIFVAAYGVARYFHPEDNKHCWMNDSFLLWIFSVPVCISLVSSFFFLINVLRVIVRKLHPQSAQPAPLAIRKAVRATIILVPLFGLQHFLLPYRPDSGTPLERFYQLLSVILVSLQGFVVSFLFCFANHDVTFAVRSLLNRLMPSIVSPPPPTSSTGQVATTTPSRELGV